MSGGSPLDRGIDRFGALIRGAYAKWDMAGRDGFAQRLNPRIKLFLLIFYLAIANTRQAFMPGIVLAGFIFLMVLISCLDLTAFYKKVFLLGFFFGFLLALPSSLNIVVKGEVILPVIRLPREFDLFIWHIPKTIGITRQGAEGVGILTLRVINSLSLSFLVIYTTPFTEIMRALKGLKAPDPFLVIVILAYKYIFVLGKTLEEVHLAKKSKTIEERAAHGRNWIAGRAAFLFRKTRVRCDEVFDSMLSRGFSGEIVLYGGKKMERRDFVWGSILALAGMGILSL